MCTSPFGYMLVLFGRPSHRKSARPMEGARAQAQAGWALTLLAADLLVLLDYLAQCGPQFCQL